MRKSNCSILFAKTFCQSAVFVFLIIVISLASRVYAQAGYKEITGYLLKEVDPDVPYFYNRFRNGLIAQYYSDFYVADEKTIELFLNFDSVVETGDWHLSHPTLVIRHLSFAYVKFTVYCLLFTEKSMSRWGDWVAEWLSG